MRWGPLGFGVTLAFSNYFRLAGLHLPRSGAAILRALRTATTTTNITNPPGGECESGVVVKVSHDVGGPIYHKHHQSQGVSRPPSREAPIYTPCRVSSSGQLGAWQAAALWIGPAWYKQREPPRPCSIQHAAPRAKRAGAACRAKGGQGGPRFYTPNRPYAPRGCLPL